MIELEQVRETRAAEKRSRRRYYLPIILTVLFGAALYVVARAWIHQEFSHWSKEKLETIASENLSRKVKLGHVRWTLGMDGLIFRTDHLDVHDLDGKPFLQAEDSELSLAILPLLQHQVRVMHVDAKRPIFWAKKLRPDWWNYSDLNNHPVIANIDHVGVTDGTINLIDNVNPSNNAAIKTINCQVNRPFGDLLWNFSLGFAVPHPAYETKFVLTGTGQGSLDALSRNNYTISANATKLNPSDFMAVSPKLKFVEGPIDLRFHGSGVPTQGMNGKIALVTPRQQFTADSIKYSVASKHPDNDANTVHPNAVQEQGNQDKSRQERKGFAVEISGANFGINGAKLIPRNFSGKLIVGADEKIYLQSLRGQLGPGGFVANGNLEPGKSINLTGGGNVLDLQALKQSLRSVGIATPKMMDGPFYGTVKAASFKLSGSWAEPEIYIRAEPKLVFYQPPKQNRIFQANAGEIEITRRSVTLHKIAGKLGTGTFQVDGIIGLASDAHMDATFSGKNVDIATVKQSLAGLGVDTRVFNPALSGSVEGAVGSLRGTAAKPVVSVAVVPRSIFYQPLGTQRTIELIGGRIDIFANALHFVRTKGRLIHGAFELNGLTTLGADPLMHVKFVGQRLDLSNVKSALLELGVKSPLLAEQLLYGLVKTVSLKVDGHARQPIIEMTCHPEDVLYEPIGSTRAVHMRGGSVFYKDDILTAEQINISSPRSQFKLIKMVIDHLSNNSSMRDFVTAAKTFDLTDLHSYLQAPRTPPELRRQYLLLLHTLQMEPHSGKTHGYLNWHGHDGTFDLHMNLVFDHASANTFGIEVSQVSGRLKTIGGRLNLDKVQGYLGKSPFLADGYLTNFTDPNNQTWHVGVHSQLDLDNFLQLTQGTHYSKGQVESSSPILVDASVTGTGTTKDIDFTASVGPDAKFEIKGPYGDFTKPMGEPLTISGSATFSPGLIAIKDAQLKLTNALIAIAGTIAYPDNASPQLNLKIDVPHPLRARDVFALIEVNEQRLGSAGVTGTFAGHMEIKGSIDRPSLRGSVTFNNLSLPSARIKNVAGTISAPEWITPGRPEESGTVPATIDLKTITVDKYALNNVHGTIRTCAQPGCNGLTIEKLTSDFAGGTVTAQGDISMSGPSKLDVTLSKVDADKATNILLHQSGEITGTVNGTAHLELQAHADDVLKQLKGHGNLTVTNGRVPRFGTLERGIGAAKILHEGIFDFNLNNLISTVAPYETGRFKKITADFDLNNKILAINKVYYQGTELRMRATGSVDIGRNYVNLDVAGRIPKVSKRGFLGPIANFLSIHGVTDIVEDLPEKLTSKQASKNQRLSFAFHAEGPIDKPNIISQSAVKSFHWLQSLPRSTAHPVLSQPKTAVPLASDDSNAVH